MQIDFHCETSHGDNMSVAALNALEAARQLHTALWNADWTPMTHHILVIEKASGRESTFQSSINHRGPMKRGEVKPEHFEVVEMPFPPSVLDRMPGWAKYTRA